MSESGLLHVGELDFYGPFRSQEFHMNHIGILQELNISHKKHRNGKFENFSAIESRRRQPIRNAFKLAISIVSP